MMNHSTRKSGWFKAALILAMLMPAMGNTQGSDGAGPIQSPPEAPGIAFVEARPFDQVVATSVQGNLNVESIMKYCYYNHLPVLKGLNLAMVNQLPNDLLAQIVTHIVSRKAAFDTLYAEGTPEDIKKAEQDYNDIKSRIVISQMVKTEVTDKITTPTAEEIQTFYDKRKFEYVQPFSFKMRHMILLTYEPYVVKAGDTLESIARNVCGDPAQADNIRSDEEQRPQRKTEDENQPPLYDGEKLLVPMPENRALAVRERLEGILKQMDEGKSFEELAEQYSEGLMRGKVIGPLPSGTKEMLPDLIEIAHETPVGQASRIFQTKHGFQTIQIVEKQEEHQMTLDEAREDIVRTIKDETQNKLFGELIDTLYSNPDLVINYDLIAKGDTLKPEEVIATLGDQPFYWSDAKKIWEANGRPHNQKLIDDKVIRAVPSLQVALAEVWAKPLTDDVNSTLNRELSNIRPEKVGEAYMGILASREAQDRLTDADIDAFYEANRDKYFKLPPAIKFSSMVMVVPPGVAMAMNEEQLAAEVEKLKAEMGEKLKGVQSVEDFEALAEVVNTTIIELGTNPPGTSGDFFPLDKIEKNITDAIGDLEPGQWCKPFEFADRSVISILMVDKRTETYRPLEEVREAVRASLEKVEAQKLMGELEATFAQKAQLQIKL